MPFCDFAFSIAYHYPKCDRFLDSDMPDGQYKAEGIHMGTLCFVCDYFFSKVQGSAATYSTSNGSEVASPFSS